jgi:hypothetical protein
VIHPTKESNAMTRANTNPLAITTSMPSPREAFADVQDSFDRFCLIYGYGAPRRKKVSDNKARRKLGIR